MKTYFIATVHLLLEAESQAEAADGISETLNSAGLFVKDWGYQYLPGFGYAGPQPANLPDLDQPYIEGAAFYPGNPSVAHVPEWASEIDTGDDIGDKLEKIRFTLSVRHGADNKKYREILETIAEDVLDLIEIVYQTQNKGE